MEAWAIARVVHVLGVVFWIGGVAMVTTVLLPAVRRSKTGEERVEFFERVESGFAAQSRVTTLIVGASGLYLVDALDIWQRFSEWPYSWMHAMVAVWAVFTVMLFVLEPLFLHRRLVQRARRDPEGTFRLIVRLHWGLLLFSILTAAGAVAGSHGLLIGG
jgi:uncharacterized membrane protein